MTELTRFSVKNWSPEDQPREKLLLKGVNALSNTELLAIIIGTGNKDETVVELSQRILLSAGNNVNQLGKFSVNHLVSNFKGIGIAKAVSVVAALELGKRRKTEETNLRGEIKCSADIFNYFYPLLGDLPHEEFWALFLNNRNKIMERLKVSQGGVSKTIVDGKLIYKEAIMRLASKVIVCHNHPSGDVRPSPQDDTITLRIKKGLEIFDIAFLDHLILSDRKFYSYADEQRI
jgi:DNA repair protein RadC